MTPVTELQCLVTDFLNRLKIWMGFFRAIVTSAVLAGILAGAVLSGLQFLTVYPLILAAEEIEHQNHSHSLHGLKRLKTDSDRSSQSAGDSGRIFYSLLSNILIGVSLGLILSAIFSIRKIVQWRQGLIWGIGGFIAVNLAPSLGMPPELPGMPDAALMARQTWWVLTALFTASGIAIFCLSPNLVWRCIGPLLIASPHVYGAPQPPNLVSNIPAVLASEFVTAALSANLIFWLILGASIAVILSRLIDYEIPGLN